MVRYKFNSNIFRKKRGKLKAAFFPLILYTYNRIFTVAIIITGDTKGNVIRYVDFVTEFKDFIRNIVTLYISSKINSVELYE